MVRRKFKFKLNGFLLPYAVCNVGKTQLYDGEKRGANFVEIKKN